ncbi:NUDIX hydrolase [Ectothiorhodospira mobilis]|uniref:NUDIX hydrolase n=1 Tax=Ectothiorhodospira mobilis TaxID=195064 RepID=UPI001EE8F704|nr:NUDIX hydrolase [Ectothiorhodospira mobilis]MCG5536641.1 NUDIX hydrolase [Ectothiorhodospira mobilis]
MTWTPRVTVAAIVEREGRFLLVEERADGRRVLNQPAGHLEEGESLLQATVRETLEETGRAFTPQSLVGLYRWRHPQSGLTFLRVAIAGEVGERVPGSCLDPDILETHWLPREHLAREPAGLRSPLVLRCIDDYLAGRHHPLDLLVDLETNPDAHPAPGG